ncbi:MAG: deoxyribonuclease IV [Phycisphaerales bacterium]|nr:deoxyribonuclease IV [Phycisphaerales bacterium]
MPRRDRKSTARHRFGAHMSIAGGLHLAFERATAAGCDCFQIFVKNQRQWQAEPLQPEQIRAWQRARRAARLRPVIAHGSYLLNLAGPDEDLWQRSVAALVDELDRCEQLDIGWLVIHPGAHLGRGEAWGLRRIARAVNTAIRRTPGYQARVTLETTAGQGTNLGYRFEHLAAVLARVREPERVAVCLDTSHVFAAGYNLSAPSDCAATLDEFERHIGLDRLACIHLNDSRGPCGGRVDRHEHIGKGQIGRAGFRRLVNDPRLRGRPMILETPKGQDARGRDLDRFNLARLRGFIS